MSKDLMKPTPIVRKISEKILQRVSNKHRLNPRQIAFVREYLLNPGQSKKKLMITAGYTPASAENGAMNPLRKSTVQGAIADYVRAGGYNSRIAQTYDEILAMNPNSYDDVSEKTAIARTKLAAVQDLNKIQGNYAATKVEKKELHGFVDFGVHFANCNTDANVQDGEIISDEQLHKK